MSARGFVTVVLLGLGVLVGVGSGVAQASPLDGVLTVGHSWTNASFAGSPSGEFSLDLFPYGLSLNQDLDVSGFAVGTEVWSSPRAAHGCLHPRFTMRPAGAAVLHCGDRRLWATPTWGTGRNNTFRIRDDGMLVVRTASGRIVWRSGSGPALFGTGQRLAPGHWLRNCPASGPCDSLTMRRNGDLALAFGRQLDWHTDTHQAGSSLVFRRTGALQVVGPHGHVLWGSHTGGIGTAYLIVGSNPAGDGGSIQIEAQHHPKFRWYRD